MIAAPRAGVIGAGSIGLAMAIVFARGGMDVALYDSDPATRSHLRARIEERLAMLREFALGGDADLSARIGVVCTVEESVQGASIVLECAPEDLGIKRELFASLDAIAPPEAVLASVSSTFMASEFAGDVPGRARCLVLHPANPPFLLPVAEVVPASFTDSDAVDRAIELLERVGLKPVKLEREITGFAYNRLQGALLREAYCLVRDGVIDVAGVDRLVRDGLGMRWAVIGPFETADLNTRGGIAAHAERLGPQYRRMGRERGQDDPWTPELVAAVTQQRRQELRLEDWEARVRWRDRRLAALRRHLLNEEEDKISPQDSAQ